MIFSIILCCCLLLSRTALASNGIKREWKSSQRGIRCLTGYMTDLQTWVDEFGEYTDEVDRSRAIDISTRTNAVRSLQDEVSTFKCSKSLQIKYLNMANCRLTRVPSVFNIKDSLGRQIADSIEYLTLYGNNFGVSEAGSERYDVFLNATNANEVLVASQNQRRRLTIWSSGLRSQEFHKLKELDLRACSIQAIGNHTFHRMPALTNLYLGENNIYYIEADAFVSLQSLKHIDISRNYALDEKGLSAHLIFDSADVFRNTYVESVDFSFTRLRNVRVLSRIGTSLTRMSVCYASLGRLIDDAFNGTSLKYVDLSGNAEIISSRNALRGLENHLQVLYADNVALKNMESFMNFSNLEILRISNNEINVVPSKIAESLTNLQILDLDHNRMTSWFNDTFILMQNLKLLSLRNNNINIVSNEMYNDIVNLLYLGLSGNFLVCNCHARDIYEVASNNELVYNNSYISRINDGEKDFISFHTGFLDFNEIIRSRSNLTVFCERRVDCAVEFNYDVRGQYLLLDYGEYAGQYQCLLVSEGRTTEFYNLASCYQTSRELDIEEKIMHGWNKYFLLLIPLMLLPILMFAFIFRKNFKYFLITIRNSATLSLINNNDSSEDGSIYNYDVFVSYCNEDRAWVLDALLPHVEKDCNVSVCLHERDFQVGLSILENIVSCMDRSRFIMLIISKRFLLSQWCQFEMHLAQHRLLETRREDLILVLLEEIPRRLRPNTLHYLMLTKTYIVWPKEESERSLFWKRMKKSLVMHKLKQVENVSLA